MVGHNPQFTYRKDSVYFFSRRIPKDIRDRYKADKFVMSLRTKSRRQLPNQLGRSLLGWTNTGCHCVLLDYLFRK